MGQSEEAAPAAGIDQRLAKGGEQNRLASEVFLFLHAGGLPVAAIAHQLAALGCFAKPDAYFDLDGPMWSRMRASEADGFSDYLTGLIDRTDRETGVLSALIDYRDLPWLEQRWIFEEQLCQKLRVVRLAFLDPALQAYRRSISRPGRLMLPPVTEATAPGFAEMARELVEIEQAESLGDMFCKRYGLPMVKLWIEDLARSGVPALRGLLARWSIVLPEQGRLLPIEPPKLGELESIAAFRTEAGRRHWSHALLPRQS